METESLRKPKAFKYLNFYIVNNQILTHLFFLAVRNSFDRWVRVRNTNRKLENTLLLDLHVTTKNDQQNWYLTVLNPIRYITQSLQ